MSCPISVVEPKYHGNTPSDVDAPHVPIEVEPKYISGYALVLVFGALLLSVFLVNLDQTIVATALPRITSQFNALDSASWLATAYFLTEAGFMLTISQLLFKVSVKFVYVGSILVFEIGSALCGAAPSMEVLILGRAIAGCGASGITICSIASIAQFTRLEERPLLFGLFGAVLAIASIAGPLLGGAFTDRVTWRWCFYINLPFGAISSLAIIIWLPLRQVNSSPIFSGAWMTDVLDVPGTVLCLGMSTTLLLAMQWGGVVKPWGDPTVIALFCVFGVLVLVFITWEHRLGPRALIPGMFIKRRTQVGACLEAFWLLMCLAVFVYYLPLWYQINGRSAVQSGIDILPFMLSFVISAGVSSTITQVTGIFWHMLFVVPLLAVIGAGLLFSVSSSTSSAHLLGYQILAGAGIGAVALTFNRILDKDLTHFTAGGSFQTTYVAVQAEWADIPDETTRASAILTFVSFFGGIIGIGVAGAIFNNRFSHELVQKFPDLPSDLVASLRQSVVVISSLPPDLRKRVVAVAIGSLRDVFLVTLVAAIFAPLSALLIKRHNLKERAAMPS